MFQTRIHGRGGQGVVSAAEMLSMAAFLEGKHAQAFPSFGSERMGAPVVSFCRISDKEIRLRDPIVEADAIVVQDPTLLLSPGLFDGLKPDGYALINSSRDVDALGLGALADRLPSCHIFTIPATEIALKHIGRPLPNAAMLGGLSAMTSIIRMASVESAIAEAFAGKIGEANIAAAKEAFGITVALRNQCNQGERIAC
jgi:pyruvate ferredoxin oxidoreductase gamma subunit